MKWPRARCRASARSTSTCCGKWAARSGCLSACSKRAKGLVNGVTCGAGMPYKLSELAAYHQVFYYPIISSARAFRAPVEARLFEGSAWLGGVVYEDPWLAGGHNGLSNAEDRARRRTRIPRCVELRKVMRECGISDEVPIVMAGGVWRLDEWTHWLENPELGTVVFQFGTRPLLTVESPVSPRLETAADDARRGRHTAAPILADGLLFKRGAQSVPARA